MLEYYTWVHVFVEDEITGNILKLRKKGLWMVRMNVEASWSLPVKTGGMWKVSENIAWCQNHCTRGRLHFQIHFFSSILVLKKTLFLMFFLSRIRKRVPKADCYFRCVCPSELKNASRTRWIFVKFFVTCVSTYRPYYCLQYKDVWISTSLIFAISTEGNCLHQAKYLQGYRNSWNSSVFIIITAEN